MPLTGCSVSSRTGQHPGWYPMSRPQGYPIHSQPLGYADRLAYRSTTLRGSLGLLFGPWQRFLLPFAHRRPSLRKL